MQVVYDNIHIDATPVVDYLKKTVPPAEQPRYWEQLVREGQVGVFPTPSDPIKPSHIPSTGIQGEPSTPLHRITIPVPHDTIGGESCHVELRVSRSTGKPPPWSLDRLLLGVPPEDSTRLMQWVPDQAKPVQDQSHSQISSPPAPADLEQATGVTISEAEGLYPYEAPDYVEPNLASSRPANVRAMDYAAKMEENSGKDNAWRHADEPSAPTPEAHAQSAALPPTTILRMRPVVPLHRLPALQKTLDNLQELKEANRSLLAVLDKQIIDLDPSSNAYPSRLSWRREVRADLEDLERIINAVAFERDLQANYNHEVQIWAVFRDGLTMASLDKGSFGKVLSLMTPDVREGFGADSTMACCYPTYLASLFDSAEDIERSIEQLKEVRPIFSKEHPDRYGVSSDLELIDLHLKGLNAAKDAKATPWEMESLEVIDGSHVKLPQLIPDSHHVDYRIGSDDFLRVTRYPSASPSGHGDDTLVFWEVYPPGTLERLRVAIQYYFPWDSLPADLGSLPELARVHDLVSTRLCQRFCKKCDSEPTSPFRLPNCMLFLRLYDETSADVGRLDSESSLLIPFSCLEEFLDYCEGSRSKALETMETQTRSVPISLLPDLFQRMMVGSCWLTGEHIEQIHKEMTRLIDGRVSSRISEIVHFQVLKRGVSVWQ